MKRRVWKWVVGIGAGVGLAAGGLLWSAHRRADAVFARNDLFVNQALAAIRARPTSRVPLFEPAIPGDGWSAFVTALAGLTGMTDDEQEIVPTLASDLFAVPDQEKLREIFEKYAPVVEDVRKACRFERFVPVYDYESGNSMSLSNIIPSIRTARFLSGLAAFSRDEGRHDAALELPALGIAMGHDVGRGGPIVNHLIMLVCEGIEAEAVREMLAEHSFEAAELETLARRLDRLWNGRPSIGDAFDVEDAVIRRTLVILGMGSEAQADLQAGSPRSWRYLFSHRLASAGALGELEAAFQETRAASQMATHLRPAAMDKLAQRVMATRNPVVQLIFPAFSRVFLRDNVAQMTWTLMRVATAIAWFESEKGRVPEKLEELVPRHLPRVPICPLTGLPLGYRDGAVWSAGRNGVDDGGVSGKNNEADDDDGDVVWRVTRE